MTVIVLAQRQFQGEAHLGDDRSVPEDLRRRIDLDGPPAPPSLPGGQGGFHHTRGGPGQRDHDVRDIPRHRTVATEVHEAVGVLEEFVGDAMVAGGHGTVKHLVPMWSERDVQGY